MLQWQRAETLGALVNGVFLVALCLSIFLEAIQRFVEPQKVSNPFLVLIVGCCGLLSNILGLFLFHEHGHSHGEGGHSHGSSGDIRAAEEGHSPAVIQEVDLRESEVGNESGNVANVLPQNAVAGWGKTDKATFETHQRHYSRSDEDSSTAAGSTSPVSTRKSQSTSHHRRHTSGSRSKYTSVEDIPIYPRQLRDDLIASSRLEEEETETEDEDALEEGAEPTEESALLGRNKSHSHGTQTKFNHKPEEVKHSAARHSTHKHNQPKNTESGGGHSHSDLNMRGVFLHVMGDALGNIGVIASALIIWLTDYSWRFYSDPAISLIITVIILGSAIPLCRAASRILLQAVPAGISIEDIKADIQELSGIVSCHHVHVWQLSDTKLVASLHVQVEFDFKGEGSARYMQLARDIQVCLHEYGIHSSTIQPEFCLNREHHHSPKVDASADDEGHGHSHNGSASKPISKKGSKDGSLRSEPDACLLDCGDECGPGKQCCAPSSGAGEAEPLDDHHRHGHSH